MLYSLLFILASLLSQSSTLAAVIPTPNHSFNGLQTAEDVSSSVTSFHTTLSPNCASYLNELKAHYNTIFDGDYSSKFDDIFGLCYINNEVSWGNSGEFDALYLDKFEKIRENCCLDSMQHGEGGGAMADPLENFKLPWKYPFFLASFSCLLVVFKAIWKQNLCERCLENVLQSSDGPIFVLYHAM